MTFTLRAVGCMGGDSLKCASNWMYLADVGHLQEIGSRKDIFLLVFVSVLFLHGLWGDDIETKVKKLSDIGKWQYSLTAWKIRNVSMYMLIRK